MSHFLPMLFNTIGLITNLSIGIPSPRPCDRTFLQVSPLKDQPAPSTSTPSLVSPAFDNFQYQQTYMNHMYEKKNENILLAMHRH